MLRRAGLTPELDLLVQIEDLAGIPSVLIATPETNRADDAADAAVTLILRGKLTFALDMIDLVDREQRDWALRRRKCGSQLRRHC